MSVETRVQDIPSLRTRKPAWSSTKSITSRTHLEKNVSGTDSRVVRDVQNLLQMAKERELVWWPAEMDSNHQNLQPYFTPPTLSETMSELSPIKASCSSVRSQFKHPVFVSSMISPMVNYRLQVLLEEGKLFNLTYPFCFCISKPAERAKTVTLTDASCKLNRK